MLSFSAPARRPTGQRLWLAALFIAMLGLAACGEVTVSQIGTERQTQLRTVSIADVGGRDGQLFMRELRRRIHPNGADSPRYELRTTVSFSASTTLSVQGASSTLKRASMTASFSLVDLESARAVLSDNITADATTGTITSLYGQDRSEFHARERLAILLAQRTSTQLYLHFLKQND
jgi:hypothetical protein